MVIKSLKTTPGMPWSRPRWILMEPRSEFPNIRSVTDDVRRCGILVGRVIKPRISGSIPLFVMWTREKNHIREEPRKSRKLTTFEHSVIKRNPTDLSKLIIEERIKFLRGINISSKFIRVYTWIIPWPNRKAHPVNSLLIELKIRVIMFVLVKDDNWSCLSL